MKQAKPLLCAFALVTMLGIAGCGPAEYKNSHDVPAGDLSTKQNVGQPIARPGTPGSAGGPATPVSTIPMNGKPPGGK